jgi:DNA polymerase/3'-5' exonuclease PolX
MMNNRQLAEAFTMIADLLEIKGEIVYKTLAYRKAADSLLNLGREASEYWKEGKLEEIPGVGKAISEKIDELLSTGKLGFLEKLKKEIPTGLVEWLPIPGLGPKRAAMSWKPRQRKANCAPFRAWAPRVKQRFSRGLPRSRAGRYAFPWDALCRSPRR